MTKEQHAARKRRRVIYIIAAYGIAAAIMIGGVLLFLLTDQTLASYLVSLAGLAVAAVGLLLTYKAGGEPSAVNTAELGTKIRSDLRADDVRDSKITGIDAAGDDQQRLSSRVRLGRVTGSRITGVRVRRQQGKR